MNLEKLEKIISLEEKEGYSEHLEIEPGKLLYCKVEEQDDFINFIDKNWVNLELTYRTFEREFLKGIVAILEKENRTIDEENNPAQEVIKEIEIKYPEKEFSVYDEIMGIFVESKGLFEDFTIYDVEKNRDELEKEIKMMIKSKEESEDPLQNQAIPQYVIETKVKARESEIALELADKKNKNFIDLLHIEHFNGVKAIRQPLKVSIGRKISNNNIQRIAKAGGNKRYRSQTLMEEYIEYESYERDEQLKNLWKLIVKDNLNDLEKIIINSINWLGEAIQEVKFATSILKAIIFLEAIIKKENERSIKEKIAQRTAVIIGNKDKNININNIYKDMRRLYEKRSEINHTGEIQVKDIDKIKLINYAKEVLIQLTTNAEYQGILNQDDLVDKLETQTKANKFTK
ncbi:HEPN domain-containing protein [Fusobacterium ulcerans]|uniref:Uncharacterized protein n=1 Tax=Fusobacterium ulcerans 12-1B TaxID=457404 RepID=S2LFV8_9FUSO|nr:HEPN domain-containing protein [Fusobacterium ulcerans]EPC08976.1 hypothetical protein HMPREF0402_04295 [Fusobacterium ulcerans 12-1B]